MRCFGAAMRHVLCQPSDRSLRAAEVDGDPVLFLVAAQVCEAVRLLVTKEPRVARDPLNDDDGPAI